MYENTPQWRHSFFDKCEFWERRLNLLVSQIFYCDILKPLALVLLWKMQDVWVLQSVFFMFWSRDLRHMVWLIKRDRRRTFKPLFNAFSNLCSGAPNGNFRENICSEDDLRTRIFGAFAVKFLACLQSPRIFEHLQNGITTHFKRIFTLKKAT